MTFFDKMSCRRARVKIKSGMVTLLFPCVEGTVRLSVPVCITLIYMDLDYKVGRLTKCNSQESFQFFVYFCIIYQFT